MKIVAWLLQILLAVAFAGAGSAKLVSSRAELVTNPNMAWAEDFTEMQIRLIGAAEVAGAIGLLVPAATGILPMLTPVAALGLAVLMGGAAMTHVQRGEPPFVPLMLAALAIVVAGVRYRMLTTARR